MLKVKAQLSARCLSMLKVKQSVIAEFSELYQLKPRAVVNHNLSVCYKFDNVESESETQLSS